MNLFHLMIFIYIILFANIFFLKTYYDTLADKQFPKILIRLLSGYNIEKFDDISYENIIVGNLDYVQYYFTILF